MMRTSLVSTLVLLAAGSLAAQTDYVHYESPQTHPLRLSPSGERLFAVNTADSRLSVFDLTAPSLPVLIAEIPVGLEPVSVHPRTEDEVWVVNQVSDSVSVVSVAQGVVIDTLPAGDEPCDVVFAGGHAYLSAARSAEVWVYDGNTRALVTTIPLTGEHPRAMAVSPDGSKVYVAFALSGNRTTTLLASQSPPQPPPTNPNLPAPPQVALIVDPLDPTYAPGIPFTVLDHDVAEIDVATHAVTRYFERAGTTLYGIAVRPGTGDLYVTSTDARNLVRYLPNLRGHFVDHLVSRITVGPTPVVTPVDLNPGVDYQTLPNPGALATALAEPTAIVFDPSGAHLYVAAFGTDRIAKVDPDGQVLSFVSIDDGGAPSPRFKRGPRGLALRADVDRLYVQNRLSNTLTVIDTASNVVVHERPIGAFDPTPPVIREGRGFLYDAKLSGNGLGSCASCHIDADEDHLAWDTGDPGGNMSSVTDPQTGTVWPVHPMKGPMVTLSMKGLAGFEPLNWRGEKPNMLSFNPGFSDLLGGSPLPFGDIQDFSTFVDSIELMPNPYRNLDGSLPPTVLGGDPVAGEASFQACTSCHGIDDQWFPMITKEPPFAPQAMKVPEFREFYKKAFFNRFPGMVNTLGFGGFHDGTTSTTAPKGSPLSPRGAFFVSMDTGAAPAIGYARTMTQASANDAGLLADVAVLQSEAILGDCDLTAKGMLDGEARGLWFDVATSKYTADDASVAPLDFAALRTKALAGDATLTFLGVPPGTGQRIGVDRDGDGVFDADETPVGFTSYADGCPTGSGTPPELTGIGIPTPGAALTLELSGAPGGSVGAFLVGFSDGSAPIHPGCTIDVLPLGLAVVVPIPPSGGFSITGALPASLTVPAEFTMQVVVADAAAPFGAAATNALRLRVE